jgi:anti-anti-sigma regulatory factor
MAAVPIAMTGGIFEVQPQDDTVVIVPTTDLRELDFQQIEQGAKEVLDLLDSGGFRNVVLDFHRTDYYGSTALGFS